MNTSEYHGLCSTCEGRATCTYPRDRDRPRLFCEEFDWAWQHRMRTAAPVSPPVGRPGTRRTEAVQTASKYKGLCATCENQAECTFPKSAGGVWHCEEFV
jgi:hypothetical protein